MGTWCKTSPNRFSHSELTLFAFCVLVEVLLGALHNLAQSTLLSLSPSLWLSSPHGSAPPTPCPLSGPLPPSISALCICRYLSPRSIHSALPSVWGHAAHLWRPRLPAQSLFHFLYLLPNPATHHSPTSLHALIIGLLPPPPLSGPDPAQPHPVRPPQPLFSRTHLAPSSTPAQRPLHLLSAHSLRHPPAARFPPPLSSLTLLSPPPASTVLPLSLHLLLFLRFHLCCCHCFRDPLFLSVNPVLISPIRSALLPSAAPPSASQQLRRCWEHVEDSEHAWHQHHLPAPWLQTQIGLGGEGVRREIGERGRASGNQGGGSVREGKR